MLAILGAFPLIFSARFFCIIGGNKPTIVLSFCPVGRRIGIGFVHWGLEAPLSAAPGLAAPPPEEYPPSPRLKGRPGPALLLARHPAWDWAGLGWAGGGKCGPPTPGVCLSYGNGDGEEMDWKPGTFLRNPGGGVSWAGWKKVLAVGGGSAGRGPAGWQLGKI